MNADEIMAAIALMQVECEKHKLAEPQISIVNERLIFGWPKAATGIWATGSRSLRGYRVIPIHAEVFSLEKAVRIAVGDAAHLGGWSWTAG